MIKVDYELLTVEGDMTATFNTREGMETAVRNYVKLEGKSILHRSCKKDSRNPTGILDNRPYIFKGQTK